MNEHLVTRVPHIIFLYWVIKIASTTLGETGADMFSMTFDIGYANTIFIFMSLFFILVLLKISLKKYEPFLYWSTFTATAIAGTAISDFIDRTLGLGYAFGSLVLLSILLIILALWYFKERSLSVENIRSNGAETYYWLAFLVANTLGTAAGDFLADDLAIGFLQSAVFIGITLGAIVLMHFYTRVSKVFLFWIAFVLTRPFGATFGDLLTKPFEKGGVDFGTVWSSVFFGAILLVSLLFESRRENSLQK